jgi:hypothetical protein
MKDGPQSIEELARATGAQQQSLYRLLRMLAGHAVRAAAKNHLQRRFHKEILQKIAPSSVPSIEERKHGSARDRDFR